MDSWWLDQLQDLWLKLKQNLPLAIATTIAMSLILGFWRKLVHLIKRTAGMVEAPGEPFRPSLPEGDVIRTFKLDKSQPGFTVDWGWRAVVLDAGVIQRELEPGQYGRRDVAKMIASMGLGENARAIVWRNAEFPVVLQLRDLFARDHQPMQLEIRPVFKIDSSRLTASTLNEISFSPEQIAENVASRVSLPARQWVSSMNAEEAYQHPDEQAKWSGQALQWLQDALRGSVCDVLQVTSLRLFSPVLDQLFREYGDLALENEAARREVERNKVRGALRQAVLAGKLEEIRDQAEHEAAVRAIEQERTLKGKALRQELVQAELNVLEEKLRVWKRKHELLLEALDPANGGTQGPVDITQRMNEIFRRNAVEAADSPFSAHEREQIRAYLQSYGGKSVRPDELLSAISKEGDVPCSLFDPLTRIRGPHTLRVGEGWKIFDGDSLWQIRLTRITTRRHGFLWQHESPATVHFEMRGSPDNRRFEQDIALQDSFRLQVGPHEIPIQYAGGTASRISLRIARPAGSEQVPT